jgi:hypothetical protein
MYLGLFLHKADAQSKESEAARISDTVYNSPWGTSGAGAFTSRHRTGDTELVCAEHDHSILGVFIYVCVCGSLFCLPHHAPNHTDINIPPQTQR